MDAWRDRSNPVDLLDGNEGLRIGDDGPGGAPAGFSARRAESADEVQGRAAVGALGHAHPMIGRAKSLSNAIGRRRRWDSRLRRRPPATDCLALMAEIVDEWSKEKMETVKRIRWALGGALALAASTGFAALNVLCTTFPIHQIARNVAQGRAGVDLQLMLPAGMGCPHDYALTPLDMRKLAGADVLVVNGLGLEEFLGAPVLAAHPGLATIDGSAGIPDLLEYAPGHSEAEEEHEQGHPRHAGANPHLFASPRQAARIALNVAAGLSKADPEGADLYSRNAQAYAERLNALADEMAALGQTLKNNRIVEPHGVFDYLARDMGLEVVAVLRPHGQEPSAAEMLELVREIRAERAGAIFTEPQYPAKIGAALARETGLPTAALDPVATGPDAAPLDYYETAMRQNMEVLRATLGVAP